MPASAYVLIVPLAAGALAYVFRRWQAIEVLIASVACGMVIAVLVQPIDATFLGIDLDGRLDSSGPLAAGQPAGPAGIGAVVWLRHAVDSGILAHTGKLDICADRPGHARRL